jgi:hypothetical protein
MIITMNYITMKYIFLLIGVFVFLGASAQVDSLNQTTDTTLTTVEKTDTAKNTGFLSFLKEDSPEVAPKKAAFYGTIFPGGGQIFNKQYWKAPLALGAVGTAGYFCYDFTNEYIYYRDAYRARKDDDPTTIDPLANNSNATDANVIEIRDTYRKWMEQSYIAFVVVYGLQVLEAYTAAHLMYFDVEEDLSLHYQPIITPNYAEGMSVGLSFSLENKTVKPINW